MHQKELIMRTVISMLHKAAETYPDRAYTSSKTDAGWKKWTFRETDQESDIIAAAFLEIGIEKKSSVSILSEGRPEWVTGEFGILKAALISVPLSIKLSYEEIAFRIDHSESRAFLVSGNTAAKVTEAWKYMKQRPVMIYLDKDDENLKKASEQLGLKRGETLFLWEDLLDLGNKALNQSPAMISDLEPTIDEHDTVNICYTSGTTGSPKGIMLTHLNYWTNAEDAVNLCDIPDGVFETLIMLPLDHSFAHTVGLYASLLRGITMHFVDARGGSASIIRNIPKNLVETNPFYLMTVPALSGNFMKKIISGAAQKGSLIHGIFTAGINAGIRINGDGYKKTSIGTRILNYIPYKLASVLIFPKIRKVFGERIQFCIGGGALLEIKQQQFFAAVGIPIYQGYGLTEAAPIICSNSPSRHKFGTSGIVAPSINCRIMKSDTEEAAVEQRGEIVISGNNVMKGYFKNKKAANEVLRDGWLWTGDLGYFDKDGFLVVTGRAKALLIAPDGEKYSPEEVEEAIINHSELVNQVMVYNDHKVFTTALVTLHREKFEAAVKQKGIMKASEAVSLVEQDLLKFRAVEPGRIPAQWIPASFEIITREFSEEDKLINSTMKLVRHKVTELYQDRIDLMYDEKNSHNKRNLAAVKELFDLS